jgi:hypothetical protein
MDLSRLEQCQVELDSKVTTLWCDDYLSFEEVWFIHQLLQRAFDVIARGRAKERAAVIRLATVDGKRVRKPRQRRPQQLDEPPAA